MKFLTAFAFLALLTSCTHPTQKSVIIVTVT